MTDARETYGLIDRDNDEGVAWGPGPWDGEPDKVEWLDPTTGLACLALRGRVGSWCGYVGVPEGHPDHGVDHSQLGDYDVHGGLTWSGHGDQWPPGFTPAVSSEMKLWWIGFDCIHYNDIAPQMEAFTRQMRELRPEYPSLDPPDLPEMFWRSYKTLAYVRMEVTILAAQVALRRGTENRINAKP